ncbi:MAG TPA: membrane dipeptidase [Gemmatimonadaceae bacterium]|nr:membrane dipeptidase [Gemmatimonadaceae bacterium]
MPSQPDRNITRRTALAQLGVAVAGAPAILRGRYRLFTGAATEYSARCIKLMEQSVVVDLLNQFRFQDFAEKPPRIDRWLKEPGTLTAADADVYRGSRMTAVALGHSPANYDEGIRFFADWNGFLAGYSDWFTRIDDASDFARAKASNKLGIMVTFQNSQHFRRPDDVNTFWGLGQRVSQLTYNMNNGIGSGFLEQRDGGLSMFGLSIVERMNQVGMAIDASHCADQTTMDAIAASKRPVIFTHANCRALAPSLTRLKTDEAIRAMAKTGGVMGVAFIRFMVREQEPVTVEHVLDHVDYAAKLVGAEHIGVGSDLDMVGNPNPMGGGMDPRTQPNFARYRYHEDSAGKLTIAGLDHPKRMFDLTEGLIRRRYSDSDIAGILGGNAVRVLSDIWHV